MAVKLDIFKAYDRFEWPYIEAMILALSFKEKWIQLVISYISLVNYSVLINGVHWVKSFFPSRGLRQEDHLSSYLFLMCAKRLNSSINNSKQWGEIQDLLVARGGTSISHFLFAGNSILFCGATKEEWCRVQAKSLTTKNLLYFQL